MDYAWVVWRGLCKLKEVNKSVMIYFGPHTKKRWVKLLVKRNKGKLNFNIFKGWSNILLPYHFQSHEWLMPNKHCWQSFISFTTVCATMLHDLSSSHIVHNPFKKHKDVSGWKIRPFANALRNKNLDTCLKSSYIHGSFKNIYIQQNTLHSWVWPYSAKQGRMPLFSKYLEFSWGKQYFSPPNYLQNTNSFSWD